MMENKWLLVDLQTCSLENIAIVTHDAYINIESELLEAQNEIKELAYSHAENCKLNVKLNNSESKINVLEVQLSEILTVSKTVYETSDNNSENLLNDSPAAEMHDSLKNTNKVEAIKTEQGETEPDIMPASALDGLKLSKKPLKK